ncbi:3-oxoacyl-acyl carrier reductase protein [Rutstroemia sp. NJR-2017a WRK4]|nr:3-oxoacyl-acyl carrier reductase protein [Rutstroemia sp. NJR-2017a WRK4]
MRPVLFPGRLGVSTSPFPFTSRVKSTALWSLGRGCRGHSNSASAYGAQQLPFAGKTIMVTGATKGIGKAIARRFAGLGGRLVLVGRDGEGLRGVLEGMGDGEGDRKGDGDGVGHEILVGDVGDLEGFWRGKVAKLGAGVAGEEGKEKHPKPQIDILVNAAGITHSSPLLTTSPELIESVLRTNLQGTIWGCKVVSRMMVRRREGCIINVSSLLGMKGGRGSAAYAASKAGVLGLTRALAAELGPSGIRVNAIVPGYIETDMTKAMPTAARTEALNAIPLSRFGNIKEIADAAVFLATNRYANNCVLNLDGGLSAV